MKIIQTFWRKMQETNIRTCLKGRKKEVKRAYGRDIYTNMNEDEENKLKKYKKTIKRQNINFFCTVQKWVERL